MAQCEIKDGVAIIPEGEKKIEERCFWGCTDLKKVVIPNSVKTIEYKAFMDCTGLTEITIPDSVEEIHQEAFAGCTGLTAVTMSKSIYEIGMHAFAGCTALKSIELPASLTKFSNEGVFSGCSSLSQIIVANGGRYDSRDNCNAIIEGWCSKLIEGCNNTIILDSVKGIEKGAFAGCTELKSITLPQIRTIYWDTFCNCKSLKSITIPNTVTDICARAFEWCSGLESIRVEEGNPKYDSRDNCNAIIETKSNTLILGCKNTIIPESVTAIDKEAFIGCTDLDGIVIPKSVTSIAFCNCGLKTIHIPDSVTLISINYCPDLTSINIPNSVTRLDLQGCTGLTSIDIPNSVTRFAIYQCPGMTSLTIPDSVEEIGAIRECTSLKKVVLGKSLKEIKDRMFKDCTALEDITIPDSITTIGGWAFEGCTSLSKITIPNSVTKIEESAFEGCTALSEVVLPDLLSSIPRHMFYNCTELKSIHIPNSVESIGSEAFRYTGLTEVVIPESVKKFGEYVFTGSKNNIYYYLMSYCYSKLGT